MNVLLQNHNAKHVCDIPGGLRELCADISREVIRSQPDDICCFIADYLNTLFITRENAKAAIKIVQSVTLKSEHIVNILVSTGLRLEEIAAVAPRLQKAFKVYLDAVNEQKNECGCDADSDLDDGNEISICQILRATGASYPDAQRAAIRIQALFRGHHERMLLAESRGEVQWQRAAANTVVLLRKSGVTRAEATHAAIIIQAAYRGYYTRKNLKLRRGRAEKEPKEAVDWCVWFRTMLEESGITPQRANQAAIVIQVAYRRYRKRALADEWFAPSETSQQSYRKDDVVSAVKTEASLRSIKSEVKPESETRSKIGDTESESQSGIEDTKDELEGDDKTTTELNESTEEPALKEATEVEQELPESSEVTVEKVDETANEAEEHTVGEQENEGAEH